MSNNTKFQCIDENGDIIYKIDSVIGIDTSLDVKFDGNTTIGSLSVETINLTGDLLQNGLPFISGTESEWAKTGDNLSYTIGNVTVAGLNVTNYSTVGSYSYDSIWTPQIAPSNVWDSVCWAPEAGENGLFCAVAANGALTNDGNNNVMTSSDGIDWATSGSTELDNTRWYSVCWASNLQYFDGNTNTLENGLFCAVGTNPCGGSVMTSINGIDWVLPKNIPDGTWNSVCWAPELALFCAVGYPSLLNDVIMISSDGIAWNIHNVDAVNGLNSICWAPDLGEGLFCAVGYSDNIITSPNGIDWSPAIPIYGNNNSWSSVCWSPELQLFCAVSNSGSSDKSMTSADGINWTLGNSTPNYSWNEVCWSPELGLFCAVGYNNNDSVGVVMTSPDGTNWTVYGAPNNTWQGVCWAPELLLFCSVAQNNVMTSDATIESSSSGIISSNNELNIQTANVSRIAITSIGNVGIGTTNPNYALDVIGDINITGDLLKDGNLINLTGGGGGTSDWTKTGNDISYTSGNVGIGMTSPAYSLDINGTFETSNSNGSIVFTTSGNVGIGTTNPKSILQVGLQGGRLRIANSSSDYTLIGTSDTNNEESIGGGATITNIVLSGSSRTISPGSINYHSGGQFASHIFNINLQERMRIGNTGNIGISGNVGIGTTTPIYSLDVVGDINITGDFRKNGNISGGGSGSSDWTKIDNNIIYTAGNVGIGTTTPTSSLHIFNTTSGACGLSLDGQYENYGTQPFIRFGPSSIATATSGYAYISTSLTGTGAAGQGGELDLYTKLANSANYDGITIHQGNLGVGTRSPVGKLSVYNNTGTSPAIMSLFNTYGGQNNTGSDITVAAQYLGTPGFYSSIQIRIPNGGFGDHCRIDFCTPQTNNSNSQIIRMSISHFSGNVGIGTTSPSEKLHVDGNILATQDITAFSDERLKTDIIEIDDALSKTISLRGVYYKRKSNESNRSNERHIGVIAQEVEKIIPEVVNDSGDFKSVAYGNIVGLLIEAIKELNNKVELLEKKINNN